MATVLAIVIVLTCLWGIAYVRRLGVRLTRLGLRALGRKGLVGRSSRVRRRTKSRQAA
jgi:hypothetical protein